MHLTILAEPTCPNAPVLNARLRTVLDGLTGISLSHEVITGPDEAAQRGMHGSPTLLIDGADPFASPGLAPSMSCRLYRDDSGQVSGAPSASQLRHAIEQALANTAESAIPAWLDALGGAGPGRIAPAEGGLRAVHQAVLRSFTQTGTAPGRSALARQAAPFDVRQVLADLAERDFLYLDDDGQITAAYPFSAAPTTHRVQIAGAAGRTDCEPGGPSASACCGTINFFATEVTATWATRHPGISGGILRQARALQTGISIFGHLLA